MVRFYFAGSIRGEQPDTDLYCKIIGFLSERGIVLTKHVGLGDIIPEKKVLSDKATHDRDMEWLALCDVLIAEITAPSHGVGYEIGRAVEMGKRVICVSKRGCRVSAMLSGNDKVDLVYYRTEKELFEILGEHLPV